MPTCYFDGVAKTPTDTSDPWSFPILSAWPNLSLSAGQTFREVGKGGMGIVYPRPAAQRLRLLHLLCVVAHKAGRYRQNVCPS